MSEQISTQTSGVAEETVRIQAPSAVLEGVLAVPQTARGIVVFAHGSGSGRKSPRNQAVARQLQQAGFGTLLLDLLTPEEDARPEARFEIELMTRRLKAATLWLKGNPSTTSLEGAYFGGSTGAAVALRAAADFGPLVRAVVSRGGRPDLAWSVLGKVRAPTLLIVGALDTIVLALNRRAYEQLGAEKELVVIPGASHLFEERGALDAVSHEAIRWFKAHLVSAV